MTKENSLNAQKVSDAFWKPGLHVGLNYRLVQALRALADANVGIDCQNGKRVAVILRSDILSIAAEIEQNYED